jgi:hypothetical protein
MKDALRIRVERLHDVVDEKLKAFPVQQVGDVTSVACDQAVDAGHLVSRIQQALAQVRSHEARSACH